MFYVFNYDATHHHGYMGSVSSLQIMELDEENLKQEEYYKHLQSLHEMHTKSVTHAHIMIRSIFHAKLNG